MSPASKEKCVDSSPQEYLTKTTFDFVMTDLYATIFSTKEFARDVVGKIPSASLTIRNTMDD